MTQLVCTFFFTKEQKLVPVGTKSIELPDDKSGGYVLLADWTLKDGTKYQLVKTIYSNVMMNEFHNKFSSPDSESLAQIMKMEGPSIYAALSGQSVECNAWVPIHLPKSVEITFRGKNEAVPIMPATELINRMKTIMEVDKEERYETYDSFVFDIDESSLKPHKDLIDSLKENDNVLKDLTDKVAEMLGSDDE